MQKAGSNPYNSDRLPKACILLRMLKAHHNACSASHHTLFSASTHHFGEDFSISPSTMPFFARRVSYYLQLTEGVWMFHNRVIYNPKSDGSSLTRTFRLMSRSIRTVFSNPYHRCITFSPWIFYFNTILSHPPCA